MSSDSRSEESCGNSKRRLSSHSLGYLYMLLSTTGFAVMAAVSKKIGTRATSNEKLFWRAVFTGSFTLAGHLSSSLPIRWPQRPLLMVVRGLLGHVATVAYMEAIQRLPLAEAAFLGKIHPFAAAVFAWVLLGEPLHLMRVLGIFLSLGGVALIAQPSADGIASGSALGVALGLLAGTLTGGAYCCVRALGRSGESELWMVLSFPLVSAPIGFLDAWAGVMGRGLDQNLGLLLLALGASTQAGQIFLARGLRQLPAANGTQTMYFGTVVSVMLGVMLGDSWPNWRVFAGGGIIFISLRLAELGNAKSQEESKKD